MRLVHLPAVRHRVLETLSHTAVTILHRSIPDADCAIVFNAGNAPLIPVLRAHGIPVATHVDGLEWRRAKWGGAGRGADSHPPPGSRPSWSRALRCRGLPPVCSRSRRAARSLRS